MKNKLNVCIGYFLLLAVFSSARASEVLPVIVPPSGFDEGTQTQLSQAQMEEILPWAVNSEITLKDLLESARGLPADKAKDLLTRGIREVVLKSAPKQTEILMRYVLNRALKVNEEIERVADVREPGVLDQELRVLSLSARLALEYYQSDVDFLNGRVQKREAVVSPSFARFGVRYAKFLMSVDDSLFNARAQYNIAVIILGLFQWDLYRDEERLAYSPAINKVQLALTTLPEKNAASDQETTRNLRVVKSVYKKALTMVEKRINDLDLKAKAEIEERKTTAAERDAKAREALEQERVKKLREGLGERIQQGRCFSQDRITEVKKLIVQLHASNVQPLIDIRRDFLRDVCRMEDLFKIVEPSDVEYPSSDYRSALGLLAAEFIPQTIGLQSYAKMRTPAESIVQVCGSVECRIAVKDKLLLSVSSWEEFYLAVRIYEFANGTAAEAYKTATDKLILTWISRVASHFGTYRESKKWIALIFSEVMSDISTIIEAKKAILPAISSMEDYYDLCAPLVKEGYNPSDKYKAASEKFCDQHRSEMKKRFETQ